MSNYPSWILLFLALACPRIARSQNTDVDSPQLVQVSFEYEKELRTLRGELVNQDSTAGLYLLDGSGKLHTIPPSTIKRIEELDGSLEISTPKQIAEQSLTLMPAGSKFLITKHFVVCYNTSDVYANWNAKLYENLYNGFYAFWKSKGIELTPPRFPLVAMVFESKDDYVNFASREFAGSENTLGYYHQSTNRLATCDLTGIEGMLPPGAQVDREDLITAIFSRPQAERTIATVIHEACHQIAFNSGLQTRMGDNPRWLSEGIAMFFEPPDFTSSTGWGGSGKINNFNLMNVKQYLQVRKADSLEQLLVDDTRLTQANTMTACYSESWALTFFLIKNKSKNFVEYLKTLRARKSGTTSAGPQRIEDFKKHFGKDLSKVDKELVLYLRRLRDAQGN